MARFTVLWSKAYCVNGETVIEAEDIDDAYEKADNQIGDWEGRMMYCPDDNQIEIE